MPTTSDYLEQLEQDREDLVDNLESKGITGLTGDETFTELVPEVLNIPSESGGLDWSAIGYSETPQSVIDGYNYAVEIMNNWDDTSTMANKFENDNNLIFMPFVDITKSSALSNMFQYCTYLMEVPNLDYSNATQLHYMFSGCGNLKSISNFNVTGNIQYAFSYCAKLETIQGNMAPSSLRQTFVGCENLKNVPVIDASSVSGSNVFQNTFQNCTSLTDTSLDNILQTCISATSYSGTKTLARLGITDTTIYPASRIQALTHYQDFIDAGWTIS